MSQEIDFAIAKGKMQERALGIWWQKGRGSFEMCTGSGKTFLSLMIIRDIVRNLPTARVLYICSKEVARDVNVPKELKKHNLEYLLPHMTIECVQTVYKWVDKEFDLIIADEVHNYISPQYIKVFHNIKCKWLACFSATIPYEKKQLLKSIAPTIFYLGIKDAIQLGIVSDYRVINIPVPLVGNEFNTYHINKLALEGIELSCSAEFGKTPWELTNVVNNLPSELGNLLGRAKHICREYNTKISERYRILHKYDLKVKETVEILKLVNDRQCIIFNEFSTTADIVAKKIGDTCRSYHYKIANKTKQKALDDFASKELKYLSVVKALNEIYDVPDLSMAITASATGLKQQSIQRKGRVRSIGDKMGIMINLYCPNTQDQVWLESRNRVFEESHIDNLKNSKELLDLEYV